MSLFCLFTAPGQGVMGSRAGETSQRSTSAWKMNCLWSNRWRPYRTLISTGYILLGDWLNPQFPGPFLSPPMRGTIIGQRAQLWGFCKWAQLNSGWWLFGLEEMAVLLAGPGVPGSRLSLAPGAGCASLCHHDHSFLKPGFLGSNSHSHNYVTSTLLTELFPQTTEGYFLFQVCVVHDCVERCMYVPMHMYVSVWPKSVSHVFLNNSPL